MNKKIIAALLAVTAVFATFAVMADEDITVLVDNKKVEFEGVAPFIENGHTLVPFRAIFEALGARVQWEGETRTVFSYEPTTNTSITFQIDADEMFVNGVPVALETPARIVNDFTVVPVRAISEGLSRVVNWDGDTRTVTVE